MKKKSSDGDAMRAMRESLGLTQQVWADLLDTTRARIANYEINKYRTPGPVLRLAKVAASKIECAAFLKRVHKAVEAAKKETK